MKKVFNFAGFITATTLGIGTVLHTYGTSYKDLCDNAVGSNDFARFVSEITGQDVSSAGRWVSPKGSAVCDTIGAIEKPVARFFGGMPALARQ